MTEPNLHLVASLVLEWLPELRDKFMFCGVMGVPELLTRPAGRSSSFAGGDTHSICYDKTKDCFLPTLNTLLGIRRGRSPVPTSYPWEPIVEMNFCPSFITKLVVKMDEAERPMHHYSVSPYAMCLDVLQGVSLPNLQHLLIDSATAHYDGCANWTLTSDKLTTCNLRVALRRPHEHACLLEHMSNVDCPNLALEIPPSVTTRQLSTDYGGPAIIGSLTRSMTASNTLHIQQTDVNLAVFSQLVGACMPKGLSIPDHIEFHSQSPFTLAFEVASVQKCDSLLLYVGACAQNSAVSDNCTWWLLYHGAYNGTMAGTRHSTRAHAAVVGIKAKTGLVLLQVCPQLRCMVYRKTVTHTPVWLYDEVMSMFNRMPDHDYHPRYPSQGRWWLSITIPMESPLAATAMLASYTEAVLTMHAGHNYTAYGDMHVFERPCGHARLCIYLPVTGGGITPVGDITYACFESENAAAPVIKHWCDKITAVPDKTPMRRVVETAMFLCARHRSTDEHGPYCMCISDCSRSFPV